MLFRSYASDMLLGMQSQEEVLDIQPVKVTAAVQDLNAAIPEPAPAEEPESDELF